MTYAVAHKSFFSRFKDRVRNESQQDPGGRYFSILLEQLFYEMPQEVPKLLFPNCRSGQFTQARVDTEYFFIPKKRRADLTFFDPQDRPIGLIEVKEEDQLGTDARSQAQAYLKYVRKNSTKSAPVHFAYVTKHFPSRECQSVLQRAELAPIFYADLYRELRKNLQKRKSPIAQLFCKYLEEEGVVYEMCEEFDDGVFKLLLRHGCNYAKRPKAKDAAAERTTAERMAQTHKLLGTLQTNAEVIGRDFHQAFRPRLGNRFLPKFAFYPRWKVPELTLMLQGKNSQLAKIDVLDRDYCDGGELYVWSEGRLKDKPQPYVYVGYRFRYSISQKPTFSKQIYGGVSISNIVYDGFDKPFRKFPDQHGAQLSARRTLCQQIKQAIEENPKLRCLEELMKDILRR